MDEVDETVEMDEMDEAREDRDRSDIIDSGLERVDATLATDGRRDPSAMLSFDQLAGMLSIAQRLNIDICAVAIAAHIEGRRELQTLAAGVLEAIDDGVMCGVGRGPIRASAGDGGRRSGFGSRKRGMNVDGVGVPS